MQEPEHQAQIDAWTGAVTPATGVRKILERTDPEMADSELVFPSKEYTKNRAPAIELPGGAEGGKAIESAWAQLTGA